MRKPIRHGDVILSPASKASGEKLGHLILAHGEVTGHKHQITSGKAELYERDDVLYLKVLTPTALLTHEEHCALEVPKGVWEIKIQREYSPEGWRYVAD